MKRQEIKRRPLADTTLSTLEPEATVYREHDGNGLYFRVKPNGQKSWELRYKKPDGKWSWLGLGGYPEVSGTLARKKAAELRAEAANGNNPLVTKHARKAAAIAAANNTFEKLAREWFEARRPSWEEGTARRIIGALQLHVFPVFGSRPFTEISPMEWMEFLREMERKGIVDQTGNVRRFCKEIYDLARVTGRALYNPLEGLHKFLQTRAAENYAHVPHEELPTLLRTISAYPHASDIRLGLRLLMLTAVRPSELREAPWSEFDLKKALWNIPAARMKKRRDHVVPLSNQALEILRQLQELNGRYPCSSLAAMTGPSHAAIWLSIWPCGAWATKVGKLATASGILPLPCCARTASRGSTSRRSWRMWRKAYQGSTTRRSTWSNGGR